MNEEMSGSNLTQALEEIHTAARQRLAEATKARRAQRRENLKRELNDPSSGYAAFYGALRAEQMRPTSVLQTETGLTANLPSIMVKFTEKWKTVYNRLEASPPSYDDFKKEYGKYMTNEPAGNLRPNGAR